MFVVYIKAGRSNEHFRSCLQYIHFIGPSHNSVKSFNWS